MALLGRAQTRDARRALAALSRRFLATRIRSVTDPSLANGLAGLALAHAALDHAFPDVGHAPRAQRALARAMALFGETSLLSLFRGFAGVAWVVELLTGDASAPAEDDPIAAVDAALERELAVSPSTSELDLVDGLVGIAVYALERLPRASASRLLTLVVQSLGELAERRRPGVAWRSRSSDRWDLGVAHGTPGVIAVLGRIAASTAVDARTQGQAHALLVKAVAWLLAQELPRSAGGAFAFATGPDLPRAPTRLAWCYGDPGVAAALLVAARAVREPVWTRHARRIALVAAARSEESAGVVDAGLCHGTAGLAHVFQRLYEATGDARLASASRAWFGRTLARRKVGRGFGGYASSFVASDGAPVWRSDPGFLTGAAGVTLALLAAVRDDGSAWDRVLLLA